MTLQGAQGLQRRLEAIRSAQGQRAMMGELGQVLANRAIKNAPYRSRNLQRSIKVTTTTSDSVTVEVQSGYGLFVERGTRPHIIRPRNAKALAWATAFAGPGQTARATRDLRRRGSRLTGEIRRGAAVTFARFVRHPGTQAQPFLEPAARDTIRDSGLVTESIVSRWNKAD